MLLGEYRQTVNEKGQILIPEQVLSGLAGDLILTRGFERNLLLYPGDEWRNIAEKLLARPLSNADVRAFRRRLFSGASQVHPDANGRIVIPSMLRDFAGINSEAVISGMYDHLEIWNRNHWLPAFESATEYRDSDRWDAIGI
jgi:MraZ protein